MRRFLIELKLGLYNLLKWFSIIYNDRNDNYYFIYENLKNKLILTAYNIEKNNKHNSVRYDVRNMKLCAKLIEKLQNEYYKNEILEYYVPVFLKIDNNVKELYPHNYEITNDDFDNYFSKYKRVFKSIPNKDEKDSYNIAREISYINHNRAKKLLFKLLEENIEEWWD
jgi:hypothetical protein